MRISDWSSDVCSSDLRVQAAANIVIAQLIATLSQNIGELSPRGDARTAVRGRLAQDGRNHRVSGHANSAPQRRSLVSICLPASVNHRARSEEHTSELQSLMRISYAVFCLKKKTTDKNKTTLPQ